jgi:hypothetical protein
MVDGGDAARPYREDVGRDAVPRVQMIESNMKTELR